MRIVAGRHRGRVLAQFAGSAVRPTADRVKESVFQILSARLVGARVLDLFCGSGALGLESLSRGAREAVFNDRARESVAIAKKNLAALHEEGRVFCLDYTVCLMQPIGAFDVIFCDPPYREDIAFDVLSAIRAYGRLARGGVVVYESEREEQTPEGWVLTDRRRYGRTVISFFQRSAA